MVCNSQPGTSIGSVYAIDDSSQVVYSVQSPSFTINRSSGEIFTSSPITSNTPITFTVTASDNQGLTGQASVTVSVNGCGVPTPSVPVINQPTAITVSVCDPATNMVVPGMALGFVSASSPSAGNGPAGGLQFTILNDRRFSVNSATGQISAAATLDSGSYLFQVQVVDPRLPQLSSSATFTVIVDCTSITYRPCNPASVEATVSEGAAVGVTVITLSGNNVAPVNNRPYSSPYTSSSSSYYNNIPTYYSQQASFPSEQYAIPPTAYYGNYPSAGGLGGNSNSLSDQYASLGGSGRGYRALPMLRRAAPPRMVFRERRQTGGSLLASLQSPVGSAFAGNGMGGSTGVQGWSILQASVPGQFRVDANSGRVYVAQPLDRERTDSYVLRVRNSYGNQACVTRVGIDVLDVNDNAPIFNNATYAFTAPCGTSSALIGVVTARDADSGLRGFVTYSILNSDNSVFTIDTFSGEIRSRTSIGAGALPQSLTIQADNPTTPSRSTTTTATVNPGAGC
ncbi:protocadherin Fat 4-like [Paramacrobiotus metropolitanus]|uniref:protocadherin Fat 4-like n=1 Tax=Paramacrobiotus metropolitanus TaxID=2943436 RepID=UPI00244572E5|nr:protocadherin Fat 4-like [Paramacrobiotus metropolitanus]